MLNIKGFATKKWGRNIIFNSYQTQSSSDENVLMFLIYCDGIVHTKVGVNRFFQQELFVVKDGAVIQKPFSKYYEKRGVFAAN
jgi:hypothetical protein